MAQTLGKQIKRFRLKERLTMRAAALLAKVSPATLSRIEREITEPDSVTFENLQAFLNGEQTIERKTTEWVRKDKSLKRSLSRS